MDTSGLSRMGPIAGTLPAERLFCKPYDLLQQFIRRLRHRIISPTLIVLQLVLNTVCYEY